MSQILPGTGRGTSRRLVEGAHLGTGREDPPEHSVHVVENVARGDALDSESISTKQRVPSRIAAWLVAK